MIPRCDGVTCTCPMDSGRWLTTVEKPRYCDINFPRHGNTINQPGGSSMPFLPQGLEDNLLMLKLLSLTAGVFHKGNLHFQPGCQISKQHRTGQYSQEWSLSRNLNHLHSGDRRM